MPLHLSLPVTCTQSDTAVATYQSTRVRKGGRRIPELLVLARRAGSMQGQRPRAPGRGTSLASGTLASWDLSNMRGWGEPCDAQLCWVAVPVPAV